MWIKRNSRSTSIRKNTGYNGCCSWLHSCFCRSPSLCWLERWFYCDHMTLKGSSTCSCMSSGFTKLLACPFQCFFGLCIEWGGWLEFSAQIMMTRSAITNKKISQQLKVCCFMFCGLVSNWHYDCGPNAMSQITRHWREAKQAKQPNAINMVSDVVTTRDLSLVKKYSAIFLEVMVCTRPTKLLYVLRSCTQLLRYYQWYHGTWGSLHTY